MSFADKIDRILEGEEEEKELEGLETSEKSKIYSSKDARYHLGLGAGAAISGLGAASYYSFNSGRYLLGATSLGTALLGGSLLGGFALRSYLKLGGRSALKGYDFFSSSGEEEHVLEAAQDDSY